MTYEILTVCCGGPGLVIHDHKVHRYTPLNNVDNKLSPCQAYQKLFESSKSEVLIYIHDDVTIYDPEWLPRVMELFETHTDVAVIGLGGATSLGHSDLYKRPYRISDMARGGYMSNQTDWQTHGGHETGIKQVAVVDAYFLAVRRDFLLKCRTPIFHPPGGPYENASGVPSYPDGRIDYEIGWPVHRLTHHCLDLWACCEAARQGKEVWMVGAECLHSGGGTSVKDTYRQAKWLQGGTLEEDHQRPHRWLYDEYRDVLPIQVSK